MKTKLITIIVFTFSLNAFCQYRPMLEDGNTWHTYHYFEGAYNNNYTIEGDTIINDALYKKLIPMFNYTEDLILLREDTINKKVYEYIQMWGGDYYEESLYDFDADVGDTIYVKGHGYDLDYLILDSITNSVYYFDVVTDISFNNPKVYYFSNNTIWIEGIGSLTGLLTSTYEWQGGAWGDVVLLCKFDSLNNLNYHFDYFENDNYFCEGPEFAISEYNTDNKITIYPNPSNGFLQIDFEVNYNESIRIELFDCVGNRIMVDETNSNQQYELDIQKLNTGIYFLQFHSEDKLIGTEKLIKN